MTGLAVALGSLLAGVSCAHSKPRPESAPAGIAPTAEAAASPTVRARMYALDSRELVEVTFDGDLEAGGTFSAAFPDGTLTGEHEVVAGDDASWGELLNGLGQMEHVVSDLRGIPDPGRGHAAFGIGEPPALRCEYLFSVTPIRGSGFCVAADGARYRLFF